MKGHSLFEPDILMNDQWGAMSGQRGTMSSEKRLMLGVLKSALESYQKCAFAREGQALELFEEVVEWIDCEDRRWFFSFRNICENLEINPAYLRRRLMEWHQGAVRSRASA